MSFEASGSTTFSTNSGPHRLRRILLIGASNVTFSFPLIAAACFKAARQSKEPTQLQLFSAQGHGRSFCQRSYVLNRGLPSLLECGLWEELQRQPPADESWAMIADVGNDLIYGREVDLIAENVSQVIQRIRSLNFPITYVRPPVERSLELTERQYQIIKRMMFPGPTVPWALISRSLVELDEIVVDLFRREDASIITPKRAWYGVDPIHIRHHQKRQAWQSVLETWPFPERPNAQWPAFQTTRKFWTAAPLERSYGARSYSTAQPCLTDKHSDSLWLY